MIYLDDLHNKERTIYELQELLLFCVTTPSYSNMNRMQQHAVKLDQLLYMLGASDTRLPFDCIHRLWSSDLMFKVKISKIEFALRVTENMASASMLSNDFLKNGSRDLLISSFRNNVSTPVRMYLNYSRKNQSNYILDDNSIAFLRENGYWCPKRLRTELEYQDAEIALGHLYSISLD